MISDDVIHLSSTTIEEKVLKSCSSIIAAFFPGKKFAVSVCEKELNQSTIMIEKSMIEINAFEISLVDCNKIINNQTIDAHLIDFLHDNIPLPGKEPLIQIRAKRALFIFLERVTSKRIPWGILSGIRPGKLLFRMNESRVSEDMQTKILEKLYLVAPDKIKLLHKIADIQKPYIDKTIRNKNQIAIYIGIPFCPSRCFYCSFPSTELSGKRKSLLDSYLLALHEEVKLTGKMIKEFDLKADSIYIGGGTPTVLEACKLEKLLSVIHDYIPKTTDLEFTVEAGRPDSIDHHKLNVMKDYKVNRISINPQTMQDQTLKKIGRNHTVWDIIETYNMARNISDWIINMDLILGLPDEGPEAIMDSVEKVIRLEPDNITIHAMALKRGSKAWENNYSPGREIDWSKVGCDVEQKVTSSGYIPYYLYRQKFMVGNLENIGYSLRGKESRYNIAIIEEKQNVIGLGAGASSKILNKDIGHENIFHPIDIKTYIERLQDYHLIRKLGLRQAFGEIRN